MESPRLGYNLMPTAPVEEELRRVAREQLDAASLHLAGAAEGTDPASHVHEARKAMKALRALLRLFRGALVGVGFDREDAAFRHVARLLASSRERTAAWAALAGLAARSTAPAPLWSRARDHLAAVSGGADAGRPPAGVLAAAAADLAAARERVEGWSLDRDGWSALRRGLKRTYARGRTALEAARDEPTPARLHEWRKEVKYHQHQIRLLRHGWTAALRVRRDALDELGELLGDDHDLALLSELLRRTPAAAALADSELETILRTLDERRAELERAAFALGARLYVERPRHLVRRLAAYLDVGEIGAAAPREASAAAPSSPGGAAHPAATAAGTKLA
ncbi:MAG TPA: CHAD domain-containing protein [Polyangiaceae bacterium]|mgnify:CR=1 FL=1|nr:CHAD domain-containing protein [Polyangiaceae bacterium]